jgi:hypothetical protein
MCNCVFFKFKVLFVFRNTGDILFLGLPWIRIRMDSYSSPKLDPDQHSLYRLEPNPDQHKIDADPKRWPAVSYAGKQQII